MADETGKTRSIDEIRAIADAYVERRERALAAAALHAESVHPTDEYDGYVEIPGSYARENLVDAFIAGCEYANAWDFLPDRGAPRAGRDP